MGIRYRSGYKYQLAAEYSIQTAIRPPAPVIHVYIRLDPNGLLTIMAGYAWNGCSGPTWDDKTNMRASLVHDSLYQLMAGRLLDCGWRQTSDNEFRRICRESGMNWLRAWIFSPGVRFGGEGSAMWHDEPILEAP